MTITTTPPAGLEDTDALEAAKCSQCGHPLGLVGEMHNRYGSSCRWTQGRSECLCQGPLRERRTR